MATLPRSADGGWEVSSQDDIDDCALGGSGGGSEDERGFVTTTRSFSVRTC
jgi:hypothetical protein